MRGRNFAPARVSWRKAHRGGYGGRRRLDWWRRCSEGWRRGPSLHAARLVLAGVTDVSDSRSGKRWRRGWLQIPAKHEVRVRSRRGEERDGAGKRGNGELAAMETFTVPFRRSTLCRRAQRRGKRRGASRKWSSRWERLEWGGGMATGGDFQRGSQGFILKDGSGLWCTVKDHHWSTWAVVWGGIVH
jgi:hypothetical protein